MKLLNLFIKVMVITIFGLLIFLVGRLLAAGASVDYGVVADAGFTLLEQILIFSGVSGSGLAFVLIRFARRGLKEVLQSLDANPHIDNRDLLKHAMGEGNKKVISYFKKLNPY